MRIYKQVEELKSYGLITEAEYERFKHINTRKKYFSTILQEIIDLYNQNRLYQALNGTDTTRTLEILGMLKTRNKIIDDLNKYFNKFRNKLKLKLLEIRDENDLNIKNDFYNLNAIIIDFETTSINVNSDIDIILFSALDTKTDEFIFNNSERLLEILNNRLLVAHNIRFDFNCIKTLLDKHGYYLHNNYGVITSKSKIILECFIFKHNKDDTKTIKFYTYDTYNVFPFSLKTIAELFIDFKKVCNFKYSDVIKQKGITIEIEKDKVNLEKIDFIHVLVDNVGENKVKLTTKTDGGVKQIAEALGHDLKNSEIYKEYNKNDVYITAVAFMFFDLYFRHVFNSLGFNVEVKRKFTIAGISYDILLQLCKQNVVLMLKNEDLEILEHDKVNPQRFSKIIKHATKLDTCIYTLKNNIFYVSEKDNCIYKIHMPYLRRAFKKAYKGGLVYFSDTNKHIATDETTILQFDINSSYPNAMNYIEINPYSRIFKVKINKINAFLHKYSKHMRKVNNEKIKAFFDVLNVNELEIVKKYPDMLKLINLTLDGVISVIVRGNLYEVKDNLYGINKKFKVINKEFTANVYGKITKKNALFSLYDVIRANMDMDITMLYITINKNVILRDFINSTYNMRIMLKKQKNLFETAIKLLLNSMYGKLGSCIDDVKRFYVCNTRFDTISLLPSSVIFNSLKEFLNKTQYNNLIKAYKNNQKDGILDKHYKFNIDNKMHLFKLTLKSKTKMKTFLYTVNMFKITLTITTKRRYMTNNNVFMASQITSFGRLMLYTYARIMQKRSAKILYSDTDSITCYVKKTVDYADIIGHDLGALKLEKIATMFKAVKKKFYVIDDVKKAKGIGKDIVKNLDFDNVKEVLVNRVCGKYEPGIMKTIKLQINEYKEVAGCINVMYLQQIKDKLIDIINEENKEVYT